MSAKNAIANITEACERLVESRTGRPVVESKDPADYAKEFLATTANLEKMLGKKVDELISAMKAADKQVKQLDKVGAGGALGAVEFIKSKVMSRAKELQSLVNMVVGEFEKTQKR